MAGPIAARIGVAGGRSVAFLSERGLHDAVAAVGAVREWGRRVCAFARLAHAGVAGARIVIVAVRARDDDALAGLLGAGVAVVASDRRLDALADERLAVRRDARVGVVALDRRSEAADSRP